MKLIKLIVLIFVLGLVHISFVFTQDLSDLALNAHYPLSSTPNDTTGNNGPMTLINTPFEDGGIYCNGNYIGVDPDSCGAWTPAITDLNFESFAVSAMFKVDTVSKI